MAAEPPRRQPPEPAAWDNWAPYGWDSGAPQDAYGGYGAGGYPTWTGPPPPPPPPPAARSARRWLIALVLIAVVVVGTVAGVGVSMWRSNAIPSSSGSGAVSGSVAEVERAVVDITSRLSDGSGVAAGTGMVVSASGEVLTNNHVIRDGARITAQVDGTGAEYPVTVLGDDPVRDVALVQLQGAPRLPTVTFADSSALHVGDSVTSLGNALGEGGQPVASSGVVTAIGQTITVSDEMGGSETLNNLIQMNAQILQGDSGGPLLNAAGTVVGMDTAAEVGGSHHNAASVAGYAIPANDALSVVHQIQHGGGGTVQLGSPPVLGVEVDDTGSARAGVVVSGVQPGSPADAAGIANGSVITAIDGQSVTSSSQLRDAIRAHKAGDQVRIGWTDDGGQAQTATVRLIGGPPQ